MTQETIIERTWRLTSEYGPFEAVRLEQYHPTYGCSFKTISLRLVPNAVSPLTDQIRSEWVCEELGTLVREEGHARTSGICPTPQVVTPISEKIISDLLLQYERTVAFGARTEAIFEDQTLSTPEDKVLAILCDTRLCNRQNNNTATTEEIRRGMRAAQASGAPLIFLLPSFPFKDQNLFRTDLPASVPDLGEVTMLMHLHSLAMAINQVARHDVLWLILSDGTVYEDIFGVEHGSAAQYMSALRDWRSRVNIDSSVHFIDLQSVISKHDSQAKSARRLTFRDCEQMILGVLHHVVTSENAPNHEAVVKSLSQLAVGMLWNRAWNNEVQRFGVSALWEIHLASCEKDRLPSGLHSAADHLWNVAMETSMRYAAFNLAARHMRLLSSAFPSAIRATSHVKPGQVGIPREFGVAPWNGVAVYEQEPGGLARIRSMPLCQVQQSEMMRFRLSTGSFGFGFAAPSVISYYS